MIDPALIMDELCVCGHKRSQHMAKTHELLGYVIPKDFEGHGECRECLCEQFKWKAFIYKTGAIIA